MIARVWGEYDGKEIVFRQQDGGLWKAVVPKDMDGEYVVAVWVEDEAGNQSYMSTLLFAVDPATLRFQVSTLAIAGALQEAVQFHCAFPNVETTISG